jgi:ribosomal protein S27AE
MALESLVCPSCGGSSFTRDEEDNLVCSHCGNVYTRTRAQTCPSCGTSNAPDATKCAECGRALVRHCIACGHDNPGDAEYCANCNAALDTLEFVARRLQEETRDRFSRRAAEVKGIREQDAAFMEEQRQHFDEIEHERLRHLAEQKVEQRRQERILWVVVLVIVALALLCMAAMMLIRANLGG